VLPDHLIDRHLDFDGSFFFRHRRTDASSPLKPDIILISHESSDANNSDAADNQPTVFRGSIGMGANNATGIRIHGIPTFRDPDKETPDGMNLVFVWQMDGMRFCFLGSLLNQLSSAQVSQIGSVDVLFVPVGGSLSPPTGRLCWSSCVRAS